MSQINGSDRNDTLFGSASSDVLNGFAGDDVLVGGAGDDTLIGGVGFDTANYSALSGPITLRAQSSVNKGGLGQDQLFGIERIVGAAGFRNVIDGTVSGSQQTSFFVDLSAVNPNWVVNNIPGLGSATFQVFNFVDVIGTSNSDTLIGNAQANLLSGGAGSDFLDGGVGNDTLIGSVGNDTLIGGAGIDTADYSTLGGPITLRANGFINKGVFDQDRIAQFGGIERIVGAAGFNNVIDGTVDPERLQQTSFFADLDSQRLSVRLDDFELGGFDIVNFVNVFGTSNNDTLIGNAQANLLAGGAGDDQIIGGGGADTLHGGAGSDALFGEAGSDSLIGGDGNDFLAGQADADTMLGGNGADAFLAEGGDSLSGGTGDDGFIVQSLAALMASGLVVDGGVGRDTVFLQFGNAVTDAAFANIRNLEVLWQDFATPGRLTLAANAAAAMSGAVTVINGRDVDGSALAANVRSDFYGTSGADILIGGSGVSVFRGGAGDDFLDGRAGDDFLYGESGNDIMQGGAGIDAFIFDAAISPSNVDTILDYSVADDTIFLDSAVFAGIGTVGTSLAAAAFIIGAVATTSAHRIVYNSESGALLYDADGSGAVAAVQWASLTGAPLGMSNTEFMVI